MARTIATWILTVPLSLLYVLLAGLPKVLAREQSVQHFQDWGYSDGFRVFIGLCEIAAGLGLLVPRVAFWAAAGLVPIMLGAIYTHLSHGESAVRALVVLGAVAIVCALRWRDAYLPPAVLAAKPATSTSSGS